MNARKLHAWRYHAGLAGAASAVLVDPVGESGAVESLGIAGELKGFGSPADCLSYRRMLFLEGVLDGTTADAEMMGLRGSVAREKFLTDVREEWSVALEEWLESVGL